ncbi:membrane-bound lytic murein transglycosylase A [Iodidimonas nitroreducens]|uniref:peptidoglycan lytic exotransglycosylase n=1 Tax=Iodidimonas nitroreducens TaxID=1236968 RepID=A0A5A7N5W6_9PROT|nr:membrane-bound lytic murein transglycosylase A [Iodidimonas nitroreducens]
MAIGGEVGDWQAVCDRAMALDESGAPSDQAISSDQAIRDFFEQFFTPLSVRFDGSARGLFTGYYEPLIRASRTPDARYQVPIYRRPPELVTVDLGDFRDDLAGRSIAGKVENGRLQPFPSRHEIARGALAGRGLELLWADDRVDVFFLQIQGSGRALLPDGSMIALGYDGPNGHGYTSLGRLMVERRILHPDHVSAPAIADWLRDNPVAGADLMVENASYIFFRRLDGPGPLGAEGVPLTPGRSLAVDRAYLPLGAPLWLAGGMPDRETAPDEAPKPLERLMVAQDTGGAIRGGVRGDVFWGFGDEAAYLAGHMAHYGRLWLLLPTPLAQRLFASAEKS